MSVELYIHLPSCCTAPPTAAGVCPALPWHQGGAVVLCYGRPLVQWRAGHDAQVAAAGGGHRGQVCPELGEPGPAGDTALRLDELFMNTRRCSCACAMHLATLLRLKKQGALRCYPALQAAKNVNPASPSWSAQQPQLRRLQPPLPHCQVPNSAAMLLRRRPPRM